MTSDCVAIGAQSGSSRWRSTFTSSNRTNHARGSRTNRDYVLREASRPELQLSQIAP
jgi:hypothetical protein